MRTAAVRAPPQAMGPVVTSSSSPEGEGDASGPASRIIPLSERFSSIPSRLALVVVLLVVLLIGFTTFSSSSSSTSTPMTTSPLDSSEEAVESPKGGLKGGKGSKAGKGAKGGKGGKEKAAPSTRPSRSRRPSPSRPPSASSTSKPLTPCSCTEDSKENHLVVHLLDADVRDSLAMGIDLLDESTGNPQAALSGVFPYTNVVDVINSDPAYPTGRTIVLHRGDVANPPNAPISGVELNQNSADTVKVHNQERVPYQQCHLPSSAPPAYFYIDSAADQDAGEWLGESAVFLNEKRWGLLRKRHPNLKLLFKAPAPHKSAILQLYGIPLDSVAYLNPGFPCEGGNRVYFPPFGRNDAPGWSQEWWKKLHVELMGEAFRKLAGLAPKCPKASPSSAKGGGSIVFIDMSASDRVKLGGGKNKDAVEAMVATLGELVGENGGTTIKFPEAQDMDVVGGSDTKEFIAAVGEARVIVTYASSSTWILASVARGATVIVAGTKTVEVGKVLKRPGHATERGHVARLNKIVELPSDPKKAKDEATKAIKDALEGKEKVKPPKCKAST